jgi:type VI secretion system Hcp family effector
VTLKAFGLTLTQIRSVLATTPPPLARVLQLQLQAWRTRKAAAEKGLELVQTALTRIESRHRLSVEEICNLASAGGAMQAYYKIVLTNASIVEIKDSGHGVNGTAQGDERERISFAYQKIELTDLDSSATAIDDWLSPG